MNAGLDEEVAELMAACVASGAHWFVGSMFVLALVIALLGPRQKTQEGE